MEAKTSYKSFIIHFLIGYYYVLSIALGIQRHLRPKLQVAYNLGVKIGVGGHRAMALIYMSKG